MKKSIQEKILSFFKSEKNTFVLVILIALVFISSLCYSFSKHKKTVSAFNQFKDIKQLSINSLEHRKKIQDFIKAKTNFDPYFIENNLETFDAAALACATVSGISLGSANGPQR